MLFAGASMGGGAESVFGSHELDNILLLGVAVISSQSGEYTPETRSRLVEIAHEHPEEVLIAGNGSIWKRRVIRGRDAPLHQGTLQQSERR